MNTIQNEMQKRNNMVNEIMHIAVVVLLTVVIVGIGGGYLFYAAKLSGKKSASGNTVTNAVNIIVDQRLKSVGELATYECEYDGLARKNDQLTFLGLNVPGGKKEIEISYTGYIKVGFEVACIKVSVIEGNKLILIELPEPIILENYIGLESLKYNCSDQVFNKIKPEEISDLLVGREDIELSRAIENGLYSEARKSAERIFKELFSDFDDYLVVVN